MHSDTVLIFVDMFSSQLWKGKNYTLRKNIYIEVMICSMLNTFTGVISLYDVFFWRSTQDPGDAHILTTFYIFDTVGINSNIWIDSHIQLVE